MPTDRVRQELGDAAESAIAAALALTAHEMRPVPVDGEGRLEWERAIDERLRRLAAKVLPTAGEGADAWRSAMVEALSDLPAMVALTAAKKAIHRPFRFVSEIEGEVRVIAGEMMLKRRVRRDQLERLKADLARGADQPALDAEPDLAITDEMIRAMKPELIAMGLKAGFITAEQVAAARGADMAHAA